MSSSKKNSATQPKIDFDALNNKSAKKKTLIKE